MKKPIIFSFSSSDFQIFDIANDKKYTEKNYIANKLNFDYSNIQVISKKNIDFGDRAYEYYDRTPYDIEVLPCMKDNKILNFDAQVLLIEKIKKYYNLKINYTSSDLYLLTTRFGTNFERNLQKKALRYKRIKELYIEDAIANSIQIKSRLGSVVLYLGNDISFIASISKGKCLFVRQLYITAKILDDILKKHINFNSPVSISSKQSLFIRESFNDIDNENSYVEIPARDTKTSLPKIYEINNKMIKTVYENIYQKLCDEIRFSLHQLPSEIAHDCFDNHIFLTGILAKNKNLNTFLYKQLSLPCKVLDLYDDILKNNSLIS